MIRLIGKGYPLSELNVVTESSSSEVTVLMVLDSLDLYLDVDGPDRVVLGF